MSLPSRRFGLDSTGEVPVGAHHAVGSSVALRYLGRNTGKVVTGGELQRYRAAGIDLVLVFEDMGRPDQQGYEDGKADAQYALNQALARLGTPLLAPCIRFAADYDPAGRASLTDAYYDGTAAVMHRANCGPYGNDEMVGHQAARGFKRLWQTYGWSGGRFFDSELNSIFQYSNDHQVGGVGVDFNHLYGRDFGQWDRRPAATPDPHHYERYDVGPFTAGPYKALNEREVVREYDRLRAHPFVHRPRLGVLRSQCKALADRVYYVAHEDAITHASWGRPGLPSWGKFWRGWRYQGLIHRAQGSVV